MKLYHGSAHDFEKPLIEKCQDQGGEFGKAFYLSDNYELAMYYGKESAKEISTTSFYVYEYELDEDYLCCVLKFSKKRCELWENFIDYCQSEEYSNVTDFFRAAIGPLQQTVYELTEIDFTQYALRTQNVLDHLYLNKRQNYQS